MNSGSVRKDGFSLLGVGVVACGACCAGPILGVLGGITFAGLSSFVVIGSVGLVIAVVAGATWLFVLQRRRRWTDGANRGAPVAVSAPVRKR